MYNLTSQLDPISILQELVFDDNKERHVPDIPVGTDVSNLGENY